MWGLGLGNGKKQRDMVPAPARFIIWRDTKLQPKSCVTGDTQCAPKLPNGPNLVQRDLEGSLPQHHLQVHNTLIENWRLNRVSKVGTEGGFSPDRNQPEGASSRFRRLNEGALTRAHRVRGARPGVTLGRGAGPHQQGPSL